MWLFECVYSVIVGFQKIFSTTKSPQKTFVKNIAELVRNLIKAIQKNCGFIFSNNLAEKNLKNNHALTERVDLILQTLKKIFIW